MDALHCAKKRRDLNDGNLKSLWVLGLQLSRICMSSKEKRKGAGKDTQPNHSNKDIRDKLQVYEQEKHQLASYILPIKKCRAKARIASSQAESWDLTKK